LGGAPNNYAIGRTKIPENVFIVAANVFAEPHAQFSASEKK